MTKSDTPDLKAFPQLTDTQFASLVAQATKDHNMDVTVINPQNLNNLKVQVNRVSDSDIEQQFLEALNALLAPRGYACNQTDKQHLYKCELITV